MINNLIVCLFIIMPFAYFYITYMGNGHISEDHIIAALFVCYFVALCFIFDQFGLINLPAKITVPAAYMFLNYAGTKRTIRHLYPNHKTELNKLVYYYCLVTGIYLIVELLLMLLAIENKSNFILSIDKFIMPIYNFIILALNYLAYKKSGLFSCRKFTMNLCIANFIIALYEILDGVIIYSSYKKYSEWGKYYYDPTSTFDTIWILIVCCLFIFLPRFYYKVKEGKK